MNTVSKPAYEAPRAAPVWRRWLATLARGGAERLRIGMTFSMPPFGWGDCLGRTAVAVMRRGRCLVVPAAAGTERLRRPEPRSELAAAKWASPCRGPAAQLAPVRQLLVEFGAIAQNRDVSPDRSGCRRPSAQDNSDASQLIGCFREGGREASASKHVDDGKDAGVERDLLARESPRIAAAIELFMVVAHHFQCCASQPESQDFKPRD